MRRLRHALADLNKTLTPKGLKEYVIDLSAENLSRARRTAKALKLFIKEVVKLRDSSLARELYDTFKIPKQKPKYRPVSLTFDVLKKIFSVIEDLRAKAFFLLLAETGLRMGEALSHGRPSRPRAPRH